MKHYNSPWRIQSPLTATLVTYLAFKVIHWIRTMHEHLELQSLRNIHQGHYAVSPAIPVVRHSQQHNQPQSHQSTRLSNNLCSDDYVLSQISVQPVDLQGLNEHRPKDHNLPWSIQLTFSILYINPLVSDSLQACTSPLSSGGSIEADWLVPSSHYSRGLSIASAYSSSSGRILVSKGKQWSFAYIKHMEYWVKLEDFWRTHGLPCYWIVHGNRRDWMCWEEL